MLNNLSSIYSQMSLKVYVWKCLPFSVVPARAASLWINYLPGVTLKTFNCLSINNLIFREFFRILVFIYHSSPIIILSVLSMSNISAAFCFTSVKRSLPRVTIFKLVVKFYINLTIFYICSKCCRLLFWFVSVSLFCHSKITQHDWLIF